MPREPDSFIEAYEHALATQTWGNVEPLIHPDVCVTFSNGTTHNGRDAVGSAYSRNFAAIKSESYVISNVRWVTTSDRFAVYLFDFSWTGLIDGKEAGGGGCGTTVLVNTDNGWQLLAEHLGPRAAPQA